MASASRSLSAKVSDFEDFTENKVRILGQSMKRKKVPDRLGKVLQANGSGLNDELVKIISQETSTNTNDSSQGQSGCVDNKNINMQGNDKDHVVYPTDHTGPIYVLVDTSECDLFKNQKIRSGMGLYQHIRHLNIPDIDIIEAVGVSLYKVSFLNIKAANNFIKNELIRTMKLKPFIPRSSVETYGVIRGVALYLTEKEILENIKSEIKVLSVYRFQRRATDGTSFIPTTTIKIGFSGGVIPKNVILEYSRFEVSHFFPPVRQTGPYNEGVPLS